MRPPGAETARHSPDHCRPSLASPAPTHAESDSSRSSALSGSPVRRSMTADTEVDVSTRRSRGRSNVACSARAARMNTGAPNGATPSRRAAPPRCKPVITLPRSDSSPARPERPSSIVSVRRPAQCAVTWSKVATASGDGVADPAGRGGSRAAQDTVAAAAIASSPSRRLPAALGILEFLGDRVAIDRLAVPRQRALPGRRGFGPLPLLRQHIAVMILDHRVGGQRRRRAAERRRGLSRPCPA